MLNKKTFVMKKLVSILLSFIFFALIYTSCTKDDEIPLPSISEENHNWNDLEQKFFALETNYIGISNRNDRDGKDSTSSTSTQGSIVYHPLVIDAYNELIKLNKTRKIASLAVSKLGYPDWNSAYVNSNEGSSMIAIPFYTEKRFGANGYLVGSRSKNGILFNAVSTEEIVFAAEEKDCSNALLFKIKSIHDNLDGISSLINNEEAYCHCLEQNGLLASNGDDDCEWKIIEICSDLDEQTQWITGFLPVHLDHDLDGIHNSIDQDWFELVQRSDYQINQESFTSFVLNVWTETYEEELGDYFSFWIRFARQEIDIPFDDNQPEFENPYDDSWGDIASDMSDFYNDMLDAMMEAFEQSLDEDRNGNGIPDRYDIDCPWGGDPWGGPLQGEDVIGTRNEIRCDHFHVKDCGDTGETLYDMFAEMIPCSSCSTQDNEYEDEIIQQILLPNFCLQYGLEGCNSFTILALNCPGLAPQSVFNECLIEGFYDELTTGYSSLDLTSEEENWLKDNVLILTQILNLTNVDSDYVNLIIDYLMLHPEYDADYIINNKTDFNGGDFDGDINNNPIGGYSDTDENDNEQWPEPFIWHSYSTIIPEEDFIGWNTPDIDVNCFQYAKKQINNEGYTVSNYFNTGGQTIQVYSEQDGADPIELEKGIKYVFRALRDGIPVIVGVDYEDGTANPDTDNTTDHFVVIVGSGTDSNGEYFRVFDNASSKISLGAHNSNKLYLDGDNSTISGRLATGTSLSADRPYTITMIRKSKPL